MNKSFLKNEQGQALIFVVATMTVALAVGVGVSLRNLSSISRTSRTDTASRAQAAAEGGAENILSRSEAEIKYFVGGPAQAITFAPSTNDSVTAVALVTVEYFNIEPGMNYLPLEIKEGQVSEVKLDGGGVKICWSSQVEDTGSDIYYSAYNESGVIVRRGIESTSSRLGFPSRYSSADTFDDSTGENEDFAECFTASYSDNSLPNNAVGLRLRAINSDIRLGVYPLSGSLPAQGYKITSVGKLQGVEEGTESEIVVTVLRSFPYMPGIFDFGIFSGSSSGQPL